jgi:phosphate transport system ATP-binding protein
MKEPLFKINQLSVTAGQKKLLENVTLQIPRKKIVGFMGPSGVGKSTLLKCLNRMTELNAGLKVQGEIFFENQDIQRMSDPDALRSRIGMLFQQPVIFPKDILANVLFGVKHLGRVPKKQWLETAEHALREAAIWDEVKDRLHSPALQLSVGQQQRLCLARTLASSPEVILMDEPTSALDARSTEAIEELIQRLVENHSILLVTHNLGQARRCCHQIALITSNASGIGTLQAFGEASEILGHYQSE